MKRWTLATAATLLLSLQAPGTAGELDQQVDSTEVDSIRVSPRDPVRSQAAVSFEIVESAPVETDLDQPDLRNTAEVWVEMIDRAEDSLDLAEFYLSNSPASRLEPVIQAVIAAAARGVAVRILTERSFYHTYPETIDSLRTVPGIEVRFFDIKDRTGGVLHAKYFIVDRREIFLGSQNFDWRALEHIREIGLRAVSRSLALTLGRIFDLDWALAGDTAPTENQTPVEPDTDNDGLADGIDPTPRTPTWEEEPGEGILRAYLVASPPEINPPGIRPAEEELVRLIGSAEKEIVVQLLSYSPTGREGRFYPVIDNALRDAASRGVDIRMILSDWTKRRPDIDYLKSLSLVPNVRIRLSTIPEWSGGFIPFARVEHCKYMVVDRRTLWVGTSNWSEDYFHNSRNVEMVIVSDSLAQRMREVFEFDWLGRYTYPLRVDIDYPPPKTH